MIKKTHHGRLSIGEAKIMNYIKTLNILDFSKKIILF